MTLHHGSRHCHRLHRAFSSDSGAKSREIASLGMCETFMRITNKNGKLGKRYLRKKLQQCPKTLQSLHASVFTCYLEACITSCLAAHLRVQAREPTNAFSLAATVQFFRKMLQRCSAVKLQKETSPDFPFSFLWFLTHWLQYLFFFFYYQVVIRGCIFIVMTCFVSRLCWQMCCRCN